MSDDRQSHDGRDHENMADSMRFRPGRRRGHARWFRVGCFTFGAQRAASSARAAVARVGMDAVVMPQFGDDLPIQGIPARQDGI